MPRVINRIRTCQYCNSTFELGIDGATTKYCSISCREKWHYNKWKSSGLHRDKTKVKEYRLVHKYNITLDEYNNLLIKQNNSCAICGRADPTGYNWHVDHDHTTGKVRGLLCSKCNQGLGLFDENTNSLNRAIKYLNENM